MFFGSCRPLGGSIGAQGNLRRFSTVPGSIVCACSILPLPAGMLTARASGTAEEAADGKFSAVLIVGTNHHSAAHMDSLREFLPEGLGAISRVLCGSLVPSQGSHNGGLGPRCAGHARGKGSLLTLPFLQGPSGPVTQKGPSWFFTSSLLPM